MNDPSQIEFDRQLREAGNIREFAWSIVEQKHDKQFERKDHIALGLFHRCLRAHEGVEYLVKEKLIDEAWVVLRALIECAVNAVYMLHIADANTANDFNDYKFYQAYEQVSALKATDEAMLRQIVSAEQEEKMRRKYEAVRHRFDGKHGDKWCADDALFKRAQRADGFISGQISEKRCDLLWLVNAFWRDASAYTHGSAASLAAHFEETDEQLLIGRKFSYDEGANVLGRANLAFYSILLPVDVRLGKVHIAEIKSRFMAWATGK